MTHQEEVELWLVTLPTIALAVVTAVDAFKDFKIIKLLVGLLKKNSNYNGKHERN